MFSRRDDARFNRGRASMGNAILASISNDILSSTDWPASLVTKTSGQSDPEGGTQAVQLTDSVDGGNNFHNLSGTTTNIIAATVTLRLWLRAGTNGWSLIRLAAGVLQSVNLTTGAMGVSQGGATGALLQTAGTWFRVQVVGTITVPSVAIFLSKSNTLSPSYTGDGTGTMFVGTGSTFGPVLTQ